MSTAVVAERGYSAISIEGGLLPADLLAAIRAGDHDVPGIRPEDYHLAAGERLGEAASRSWEYLLGAYRGYHDRRSALPETEAATTLTRDKWLLVLLGELGFGRVPFQRGGLSAGGRSFPVSHSWQHVPIHLVGWDTRLDTRRGHGEAGRAPQSMLQDLLNTSDEHLWGVLSNGRLLRILRDSTTMVGSAYLEFDLEAIFDGELYADFVLLYATLHSSRFELLDRIDGTPTPADCRIERWRTYAAETGVRFRDQLRGAVKETLEQLGAGFLAANPSLCAMLERREISDRDLHHELLRLAYQIIFLFVAEDRDALLDPQASAATKQRYISYFSGARLRRIAEHRQGDRHGDLWRTLVIVLDGLGDEAGQPDLGLPALGGLFFRAGMPNGEGRHPDLLRDCELTNQRLLAAIRPLTEIRDRRGRRHRVDYRHLGAEELGSVYESLLDLIPQADWRAPTFTLQKERGSDRKETGSYYTPTPLIESLLNTALDPILDEYAQSGIPDDLLRITVCDPACGSGHFLVAAAWRIAKRYATLHYGDDEPGPTQVREAMAKVVRHCVYGVDINPLAIELAKISLWLESLEPGKPLAFLDAHLKVGNALLGTIPALQREGVPDAAFKALAGDDKTVVSNTRKENKRIRDTKQHTLYELRGSLLVDNQELANSSYAISNQPVNSLADVREQARRFRALEESPDRRQKIQAADAWCAAFVWPTTLDGPAPITTQTVQNLSDGDHLDGSTAWALNDIAVRYAFFHWHLEFPEVFLTVDDDESEVDPATGWRGGFSCVLGNPPWERVKLQEQEFFAARSPEIAKAPNAAVRKKLIKALAGSDIPADQKLYADFTLELRLSEGWSHLMRSSGRYPLTGRGDINTYAVFAETARTIIAPRGRCGMVLPTGIATDATTAPFFGDLVRNRKISAFLEFENEEFLLSRAVDHRVRFCLLTVVGRYIREGNATFAFGSRKMSDVEARRLTMPPEDILLLNPNTGTTPLFRSPRDAEITLGIYRRVPVLWREVPDENPWALSFMAMVHMANDSHSFHTRSQLEFDGWQLEGGVFIHARERMLPLYEAKMFHHFDHRLGTYDGQTEAQANMGTLPRLSAQQKAQPNFASLPRYWLAAQEVRERLPTEWRHEWTIAIRKICRATDERTVISAVLPVGGLGDSAHLIFPRRGKASVLIANLSSLILDYVQRQKLAGTNLNYFQLKQLPVLPPERYKGASPWELSADLAIWITARVLELTYTTRNMAAFAGDLGDDRPPFVWDEERRFVMRAELDAAYFHLYGVERNDVDYIMDTFRSRDSERFMRMKERILAVYDALADAIKTGEPYRSVLDPPPGRGPRHPDTLD